MFCCCGGAPDIERERIEALRKNSRKPINRKKQKREANKMKSIISSASESLILPVPTEQTSLVDTYNNPNNKQSFFGSDYEKEFCNGGGSPDINLHNDS